MSAIFGIIDLEGRPIDPVWIKSMQSDLAHRGPDGQGIYKENSMFFGHMLLHVTPESIYDKSPYEEDEFVITANTRLDERKDIMDRLAIPQSEREDITDSLLLLRSFRKFGKDFVKDIYGDFSFAIWDKKNKELFCARDQIGVKPFLYYFQDNRFVFSTELKAIVKLPFIKTGIDLYQIKVWMISGTINNNKKTSWINISRLEKAMHLSLINNNILISNYWRPVYKRNKNFITEQDSANAVKELLEKVITDHMSVITNVGIPLSGGLDSSTIACIAAKHNNTKLFSISSILDPKTSYPEYKDEMQYINSVLEQEKKIRPLFIYHTKLKIFEKTDTVFLQHFTPINSGYYIDNEIYKEFYSKKVRRLLSGYLGDTTISNRTFFVLPYLLKSGRFKTFFNLFLTIRRNYFKHKLWSFLKSQILVPLLPWVVHYIILKVKGKFPPWDIANIPIKINRIDNKKINKELFLLWKNDLNDISNITENIWPSLWDPFLEDWDCGSSQYNIEITYPLADRRLIELLHQIPAEHFYSEGLIRGLIRNTIKDIVPNKVRKRRDKGDYSPGHFQIFKNQFQDINELLNNRQLNDFLGNTIDFKKLKIQIETFKYNKNNFIFTDDYFITLNIINFIMFYNQVFVKKN